MASLRILHSLTAACPGHRCWKAPSRSGTDRGGTASAESRVALLARPAVNLLLTLLSCLMIVREYTPAAAAPPKVTLGWVENVRIGPGVVLAAKLDTGADHSSLHASRIEFFERGGRAFVNFTIEDNQAVGRTIELSVLRTAKIKQHSGRFDQRPVVMMRICVGTTARDAEVNLVDRAFLEYPMLIGRSFMKDVIVVDPALTFTIEPNCSKEAIER